MRIHDGAFFRGGQISCPLGEPPRPCHSAACAHTHACLNFCPLHGQPIAALTAIVHARCTTAAGLCRGQGRQES